MYATLHRKMRKDMYVEDGTYDELGEGKIIKVHKCPSGLYSYTIECEPDNFHMVFYEDELKEIGNE